MIYSRLKKRYLFLTLVFTANICIHANITNLRDTLTILKPEWYPYSVSNGAVVWEKEWPMNLWDLGWDRKKADETAGEKKDELIDPENAPALIRLIDKIFHRPTGTAGRMNFTPTEPVRLRASKEIAVAVANILSITVTEQFKGLLVAASRVKEFLDSLQNPKIIEAAPERYKLILADLARLTNFTQLFSFYKKTLKTIKAAELKKTYPELATFKTQLEFLSKDAEKIVDKNFSEQVTQISAQPLHLVLALLENPTETQMVLLALVWYCCKSDKAVLSEYYKALQAHSKTSIFINDSEPDWAKWVEQKFIPADTPKIIEKMQEVAANPAEVEALKDNGWFNEYFIYLHLIPGKYPKISGYKTATLWVDGKTFKALDSKNNMLDPVTFPDCMDSTMMNFMCILGYNQEYKSFDLKYLNSKIKKLNLNAKLVDFFNSNHPSLKKNEKEIIHVVPESIEEPEVHNAWTDVISNIPGVAYHKKLENEKIIEAGLRDKGFVIVKDERMVAEFTSNGYFPVRNNICFELKPTLKNFIVILNYLLGLNLYSNDDVCKEILKPDFIKTYLPQLAKTLQVDFDLPVSLDKIDAKDFGAPIVTPLIFEQGKPAPFYLHTSYGHGELQTQPVKSEEGSIINLVAKHLPYYSDNIPCLRGLRLIGLDDAGIKEGSWIIGNNINWPDLYWFSDILSVLKCENLLHAIKLKGRIVSDIVAKMFMRIADLQPDEYFNHELYCLMVKSLSNPILINKVILLASAGIASKDRDVRMSALGLFKTLFTEKQGFTEAIQAANAGIASENLYVRRSALKLFGALVREKQGFTEAIEAASAGIASEDSGVQDSALELFKALFTEKHGVPEAKLLVQKKSQTSDELIIMRLEQLDSLIQEYEK